MIKIEHVTRKYAVSRRSMTFRSPFIRERLSGFSAITIDMTKNDQRHAQQYFNPVQLIANTVDWSLEDRGLLSVRGRGHFSRTLLPMTRDLQLFWEYLNYGLTLSGLVLVWLARRSMRKRTRHHYQQYLASVQQGLEENGWKK